MTELRDEDLQHLAQALRAVLPRVAPAWTDRGAGDPDITLLSVFAFLADRLASRTARLAADERDALRRLLASLDADAGDGGDCALRRVSYVDGQLLAAADLQDEQDYLLRRLRRHNRMLHGVGVVDGLGVTIDASGGAAQVVVAPGFALDALGNEIALCEPARLPLPAAERRLVLLLAYAERAEAPVPVAGTEAPRPSRIAEAFTLSLVPARPSSGAALPIARLVAPRGRWRLDGSFRIPRARR